MYSIRRTSRHTLSASLGMFNVWRMINGLKGTILDIEGEDVKRNTQDHMEGYNLERRYQQNERDMG